MSKANGLLIIVGIVRFARHVKIYFFQCNYSAYIYFLNNRGGIYGRNHTYCGNAEH